MSALPASLAHANKVRLAVLETVATLAKQPYMTWAVQGVIPENGLCVLFGPSGSGKSHLAFDLCAKLTLGLPWFGCVVAQPLRVCYCALEGQRGVRQRAEAWQIHNQQQLPDTFRFYLRDLRLSDPGSQAAFVELLDANGGTDLVVIDTLACASLGEDENTSGGMGSVVGGAKYIASKLKCIVVLVHHTGKDENRGARGHSSLYAAQEAVIQVTRDAEGERSWSVPKVRDGADGLSRRFLLEQHVVGVDKFGQPVTSVAVRESDEPAGHRSGQKVLGKNETAVLQAVTKLTIERELLPQLGYAAGTLTIEDVVAEVKSELPVGQVDRHLGERMRAAVASLVRKGRLQERDGTLLLPEGGAPEVSVELAGDD